jgi:hypothetical protein
MSLMNRESYRAPPPLEAFHPRRDRLRDPRRQPGIGDLQHHELPVERRVGEGRLAAEDEQLLPEGLQRRLQQARRLLYQGLVLALPLRDAAGPVLALLDEDEERAVGEAREAAGDPGGRDAEHDVLERPVAPVGVGPHRAGAIRGDEPASRRLAHEPSADIARVGDHLAIGDEHRHLDVAAGQLGELAAVAVGHVDRLVFGADQLERDLHLAHEGAVVEAVELHHGCLILSPSPRSRSKRWSGHSQIAATSA